MGFKVSHDGQAATFRVRVVPRASKNEVAGTHHDALRVRLTAPPIEGRANDALIDFLVETLGVKGQYVEIVSGHTARVKTIRVWGLTARGIGERLRSRCAGE